MAKKGIPLSLETRAKMSQARIGRVHSAESRAKMSQAKMGHTVSDETRAKISKSKTGKVTRNLGKKFSPERRASLSASHKGQIPWIAGRKHTPEALTKMSQCHIGHTDSLETRAKRSKSLKGKNTWSTGRIPTLETRRKISEANTGQRRSPEARAKMAEAARLRRSRTKNQESSIERKVREFLERIEVSFEQEKYFKTIGAVDFYLPQHDLVIECDGKYWHSTDYQKTKDRWRDKALLNKGIFTLRLPELEIDGKENIFQEKIIALLGQTYSPHKVRNGEVVVK